MIPVNCPIFTGNEKKYLSECIDSGFISSEGPFVRRFEESFAERCGRKFGVAVSNGTAALDVAVRSLNFSPGDEIIVPSFTIISCLLEIVRSGLRPVLIDSCLDTWNLDPALIESKITTKTKAIMVVHTYGLPVEMGSVTAVCEKYGLQLIEDFAEAIGQTFDGSPCGSFGDVSVTSFYPNKHITTGEGGMLLTDDPEVFDRARSLRNLCFQPKKRFVHNEMGWNLRMTNMQAAVGLAQLEQLDAFLQKKKMIGQYYSMRFQDIEQLQIPLDRVSYAENLYWVYGLLSKVHSINSEKFIDQLAKGGVEARPFFCPMHQQPVFSKMGFFEGQKYPNASHLYTYGFYIPSGLGLTEEQQVFVADTVCMLARQDILS